MPSLYIEPFIQTFTERGLLNKTQRGEGMFVKTVAATFALVSSLLVGSLIAEEPAQAGGWAQHHPRRAEVNRRDRKLENRINKNYGNLGGHYNQLQKEDRAIHRQQRAEARANGGHITKAEKRQLNREENRLNRQIKRDRR